MNLIAMLMLAADPNGQPLPDVALLDFTASYCQPCQQMVPILQRMESDRFPIRRIDITERPDVTKEYAVDRIPTLILIVEGKEVRRFVGLTSEEELRRVMNDAARKLDMQRRAAGTDPIAEPETFEEFTERQPSESAPETAVVEAPRSGIRGVFDRVRSGLMGGSEKSAGESAEQPNIRAQSPDELPADAAGHSLPMQATVRIRLDEGEFKEVGTGTIVHSTVGQSTILTCAHIFKNVAANARVEVEVFKGREVLKYPATVLGGDHESDIAFLQIQNTSPLPMAPLLSGKLDVQLNQRVYSVGCDEGSLPTILNMNVAKLNFFEGPENIVCNVAPQQGRSGGGLFNPAGELIGVCSGAFKESNEGLYNGIGAVRKLMTELKLDPLFQSDASQAFAAAPPEADPRERVNPFANEDDLFEQMFEEGTTAFDKDSPQKTVSPFDNLPGTAAAPMAATPRVVMASSQSQASHTEITVIIDSKDPAKGKQVVVIPRPSPWLLQLLTGETSAAPSDMAGARDAQLSKTSARHSAWKPDGVGQSTSRRTASGAALPLAR